MKVKTFRAPEHIAKFLDNEQAKTGLGFSPTLITMLNELIDRRAADRKVGFSYRGGKRG